MNGNPVRVRDGPATVTVTKPRHITEDSFGKRGK
jgi:hypothetical protein